MDNNINSDIAKAKDIESTMSNNQFFDPKIKFNVTLTECLWPHHHNKYSRAEAFVDIIHILQKNTADFLCQRERGIAAGCKDPKSIDEMTECSFFETNCSALAKRWHWNRITVSNFLAELEKAGALVCIKERHSVTIYMERNA